ncbi:Sec-independent protein translocase TatB [Nesterenkonia aerolata]|uniref:Sec-independent protein translocase TatB n=1 Tax=Nesterenkonia aerolata TaxID=3074079 RepID=A0ABU2DP23_9MICC|nr:Sec-independent protein translocase TatB [Nesterenkonia sp. LY-0111]MDR8018186.1 Sec-independent protein translocase TatB [Nesterenkonia sp. LY-0111]
MGINGYQLIILVVLALLILGPERLPDYAKKLAHWVRQLRVLAQDARVRFKEETGTDFDDVNWRQYDPRQYDPRRIIREALAEDYEETQRAVGSVRRSASWGTGSSRGGSASARESHPRASGLGPSTATPHDTAMPPETATSPAAGSSDPRALFGGGSSGAAASGAVAAGLAGAASLGVTGRSVTEESELIDHAGVPPAPFDVDAT